MTPAIAAKLRADVERYARTATSTLATPLERDLAVSNLLLTARQLIGLVPVTSEVDDAAEWVRPTVLPPRTVKP
jgi:hypothetical protein